VRLVIEVEEHHAVRLEGRGDRAPEGGGVVAVGERLLPVQQSPAGVHDGQVEDRRHPMGVEQGHVGRDHPLVGRARVGDGHAADPQPAALVQRQAHHVHVPGGDRPDRAIVGWAVEDPLPLHAHIFGAGAVHAVQDNGPAQPIDQPIPRHMEAGRRAAGRPIRSWRSSEEQQRHQRGDGDPASRPHPTLP